MLAAGPSQVEKGMENDPLDEQSVRDIQERLFYFALKSVNCRQTAREITQDTMASLVKVCRDGRVQQPENLGGLAYGILRNKLADHFKAAVNGRQRAHPLDEQVPGGHPDPSVALLQADEHRRLAALVGRLKPIDRAILHLFYFENCPLPEIASRLDSSQAWIALRKHRAIKRLKKWMKET